MKSGEPGRWRGGDCDAKKEKTQNIKTMSSSFQALCILHHVCSSNFSCLLSDSKNLNQQVQLYHIRQVFLHIALHYQHAIIHPFSILKTNQIVTKIQDSWKLIPVLNSLNLLLFNVLIYEVIKTIIDKDITK